MNLGRLVPRLILLTAPIGGILWAVTNRDSFDSAALNAWLSGFGIWAPLIFLMLYAAGTVLFLPGSLFALVGGALFGPILGTALNLLSATVGASIAFLVARFIAGEWVAQKTSGRLKRLIEGVENHGWRFVAFVRLVPLFPFNLTNYAFGLTRIRFIPYVITSFVCMVPGATAYTWLGHAGREALSGDISAIRYGLLAIGLLATIAFVPRLVAQLRRNETD